MAASKNIIDDTVSTPRSRELVRLIIPILIRWAKSGKTDSTYGDLIHALGMVRYSGIGRQLGDVQNVIDALQSMSNVRIPTLNSLVKSGTTQLPSDGFDFVSKKYSSLDTAGKKVFVEGLDSNAVKFRRWDWVLDQLGLEPAKIITEEELQIKIKKMGGHGGEGEEHKNLKKFIYEHPEVLGIKDVADKSVEFRLPSGDLLDVYFIKDNGDRVAVEVKPASSPDEDMMRGIFQCVKYKAVLEAVRTVECESFNVSTILVLGGSLSDQNREIASELGVDFCEGFKMKS